LISHAALLGPLNDRRPALDRVAAALIERRVLDRPQLQALLADVSDASSELTRRFFKRSLARSARWRFPVRHVSPAKFKRALGLNSDGEASRARAIDTWPMSADLFSRKRNHNRAEAALLGLYSLEASDPMLAIAIGVGVGWAAGTVHR
jgi:hypothetical protein